MDFRFSLWNHGPGKASCLDVVDNIACQMQDCGHEVSFCMSCKPERDGAAKEDFITDILIDPPGVNVLLEAFDEAGIKELKRLVDLGLRFLIIMTETPGRAGFNDLHGQFQEQMKIRQRYFGQAAELAEAVGCLVMTGVPFAKKYNAKSRYLELGHSPALEARVRAVTPRMYDYAFSGGGGDYRIGVMRRLEHAGISVVTPQRMYGSTTDRDAIIARAHGVIGLKSNPKWNVPSNSRWSRALHVGCFVAAQHHDIETPWDAVIDFPVSSRLDDYIEMCHDMAQQSMSCYQRQMSRFRNLMSPQRTMAPFLSAVFGDHNG